MDANGLNYPIKYAIMQVEEQSGWLESGKQVVANIVSKCYVVRDSIVYSRDGTYHQEFEVVFLIPVNDETMCFKRFLRVIPSRNLLSFRYTNSVVVSQLFDTFEDALVVKDLENNKVIKGQIKKLVLDHKSLRTKHQETLDKYNKVEQMIENETCDMLITKDDELHKRSICLGLKKNNHEFL